ncbi:MAG TPA: Do family serine endopeptidase [Methylomirabilota bacterium]|nr:Do family serine endopeptidase [Methylomirabilota bacterium]
MTDTPNSKAVLPALRRKALLGGALALGLSAAVAAPVLLAPQSVATAQDQHAIQVPRQQAFSFADVVERVQPAVVSIQVRTNPVLTSSDSPSFRMPEGGDNPLEEFFRRFGEPGMPGIPGMPGQRQQNRPSMGQGSGFFISADGYLVTNNHVVDNADVVTVTMDSGAEYTAKVIGTDPKTDIALVKVDGRDDFPFVAFSEGDVRVGDWVVAVGNPFGLGGSVTAGIISARGRDIGAGPYDDFLQIDAPINRGNSGGPAFNLDGEVVGVNTAIFSPSGGSVGIGFAIPASTVNAVVADLKDDGKVVRGWLGVQIQPVTDDIAASIGLDDAYGALVTQPQDGSPALEAGMEPGDAILEVNGNRISDARELARVIAAYPPDTAVDLTVWRDGERQTVQVTLGTLPDEQQAAVTETPGTGDPTSLEGYGLSLAPAADVGAGDKGVAITDIDPAGKAAETGLREGDVILEVGNATVARPADVRTAIETASESGRTAVLMRVQNGDTVRFVALPLATG